MEQPQKGDKHGAPGACHGVHDPEGEQDNQRIEQHTLPGIFPLSEADAEQSDQHHKAQFVE